MTGDIRPAVLREHHIPRLASMQLPVSLVSCGPSQAEVEACRTAPMVRNLALRSALGAFYQTNIGKKYKAMTPAQLAEHSHDHPAFEDMEAFGVLDGQIEGIEGRYRAEKKRCAEKGL
jgi:hypothetical protein